MGPINRYDGNTGRYERLPESGFGPPGAPPPPPEHRPPQGLGGLLPGMPDLSQLVGRLLHEQETEDLLLILILYLLYRESGDTELLVILGAMLLL